MQYIQYKCSKSGETVQFSYNIIVIISFYNLYRGFIKYIIYTDLS